MSMLEYSGDIAIKEEVHNCDLCPYFTNSLFSIRNHERCHQLPFRTFNCEENALELYYCKVCDFKTDLFIFLKKHVQQIHLTSDDECDESQIVEYAVQCFICRNCTFETYSSMQWLRHLKAGCPSIETTQQQKIFHGSPHKTKKKKHLDENLLECYHCAFKTHVKSSLRVHVFNKHTPSEKCLYCDECSFKTISALGLRKHKQNHRLPPKEIKLYQCMHCPYKTRSHSHLVTHELHRHKPDNEINWFKCGNCDYKAKRKAALKLHQINKHEKDENIKWHQCNSCSYKAKRKDTLKTHRLLNHTELKPSDLFHCDKCSFSTKIKGYLKKHKLEHLTSEEIQWFQCDKCPYKSKIRRYLTMHKKTKKHPEDQNLVSRGAQHGENLIKHDPFEKCLFCDKCSFKTVSRVGLRKHKQNHLPSKEIKWYQCVHCPFKAKQRAQISMHELHRHKPENEINWFKCDRCDYKTKTKQLLKLHQYRKHEKDENIKWHKCNSCSYKAKQKVSLKMHMFVKHS